MKSYRLVPLLAALVWLAGCSTLPPVQGDHSLEREAVAGTELPPPAPGSTTAATPATPAVSDGDNTGSMKPGNGVFVRSMPAAPASSKAAKRDADGHNNGVVFNFENQPVEAVVKAILGDFLKRNYAIEPDVKGNITFSTANPVAPDEALPILETLLSWTGNALVEKDGHYVVLQAKNAVAGNLSPSLDARAPGAGMQARLFPLRFISAKEMQKLLKPFAPEEAFLLVDPMRNFVVMAGTPEQLANYQRTIKTFDVDWLKGMSVGVFTLQHASVDQLMPHLEKLFGQKGSTPLAGMLRFIPIQRTNAIVVITPQPEYLTEVHDWINRIDAGGGNRPQLYVYDVKNIQADSLATYLGQIYGGDSDGATSESGGVAPGLSPSTLGSSGSGGGLGGDDTFGDDDSSDGNGFGADRGLGRDAGRAGRGGEDRGFGAGSGDDSDFGGGDSLASGSSSSAPVTAAGPQGVRITAVKANNQLLVRCRPSQWAEIESAIRRLDVVPLQVQIETRILEVQLTGKFSFGVQWYLEGLIGGHPDGDGGYVPGQPGNQQQWALGKGGAAYNPLKDSFFYSFVNHNVQVALHAVETNGNTKVLSEPSLVVTNNQLARIQVGDQVPVNQTYIGAGLGSNIGNNGGIATLGQVEYKDTGVILKVRPRVNPGGLVYLDLSQEVSKPGTKDDFGNFPIQKRQLNTQIAVQSGQTVLLGGLIQQDEGTVDSGVPFLSRIPFLGRLFGGTDRHRDRTELLVLITPRIITSSSDAHDITQEYQRKFDSLKPLRQSAADGP